jgi:hypothetical protein
MAQRTTFKIPFSAIIPTVGTWAAAIASNLATYNKTAGDDTSVLYVPIVPPAAHPHPFERDVLKVDIQYSIATADTDAAPTAVMSKVTMSETTGVRTRATLTETEAFVGTNTIGLAVGTYVHTITPSSPVRLENNEELWLEWTLNAAATSVVKLGMPRVHLR